MGVGWGLWEGLGSNRRRQASGVLRDTQAAGQGQMDPPRAGPARRPAAQPQGAAPCNPFSPAVWWF